MDEEDEHDFRMEEQDDEIPRKMDEILIRAHGIVTGEDDDHRVPCDQVELVKDGQEIAEAVMMVVTESPCVLLTKLQEEVGMEMGE